MDIKKIIFDSPLYSKWTNEVQIEIEGETEEAHLNKLISGFDQRVEHYCTECEAKRIFAPDRGHYDARYVSNEHFSGLRVANKPSLYKTFRCSADKNHQILFGFHVNNNELIKIAEYPSKYDSIIDSFNKYKKVLGKDKLKELAKASQLV